MKDFCFICESFAFFFPWLNLSSDKVGTCSLGWFNPANFTALAEWGWRSPDAVMVLAPLPRGGRLLFQVCWSLGVLWRFLMPLCIGVCWEILPPRGKAADTGSFQAKLFVGQNTKRTHVFFWCDLSARTDNRNPCISGSKWIKQVNNCKLHWIWCEPSIHGPCQKHRRRFFSRWYPKTSENIWKRRLQSYYSPRTLHWIQEKENSK